MHYIAVRDQGINHGIRFFAGKNLINRIGAGSDLLISLDYLGVKTELFAFIVCSTTITKKIPHFVIFFLMYSSVQIPNILKRNFLVILLWCLYIYILKLLN